MNQSRLFLGCFIALVATAFSFVIRAQLISVWEPIFNLSQTQKGNIQGAGLFPFVFTIVLFSLIVDKFGYGRTMVVAFLFHMGSILLTIFAWDYNSLWWATILFALGNGTVEAVINPVTATLYPNQKTHYLNILHAGWPGGLVVGGILVLLMPDFAVPVGALWQWKVALVALPVLLYGVLLMGQRFPTNERVASGVSYDEMLKEMVRPMFLLLVLIMIPLAITELGTDSWISDMMQPVMQTFKLDGGWMLVYTSLIMFILRFFAGPIVHKISPLGLLASAAVIACLGLLALSYTTAATGLFLAATLYGVGKTFFWPTMLGVVSEQFPKGGALTLNGVSGVGMLAVGLLGTTLLGTVQDKSIDRELATINPQLREQIIYPEARTSLYGSYHAIDQSKLAGLDEAQKADLAKAQELAKQTALRTVAIFPAVMFVAYMGLILYFRTQGGYKPVVIAGAMDDERLTGGVTGPVEA